MPGAEQTLATRAVDSAEIRVLGVPSGVQTVQQRESWALIWRCSWLYGVAGDPNMNLRATPLRPVSVPGTLR